MSSLCSRRSRSTSNRMPLPRYSIDHDFMCPPSISKCVRFSSSSTRPSRPHVPRGTVPDAPRHRWPVHPSFCRPRGLPARSRGVPRTPRSSPALLPTRSRPGLSIPPLLVLAVRRVTCSRANRARVIMARRRTGQTEGTRNADGVITSYRIRYTDVRGLRQYESYATRDEAEVALAERLHQVVKGVPVSRATTTVLFGELAVAVLKD